MHRTEFERAHAHLSKRRDTFEVRALSLRESSLYLSAHVRFCARAKEIHARAGRFASKHGDSRSRIILIYFRATKMRSRHLAVK